MPPATEATAARDGWVVCPGCGVALPANGWATPPRPGTSNECWELYGEVTGHELTDLTLVRDLHQLTVDAYQAQHPHANRLPLIYALVGLHLTLDRGAAGVDVRTLHQRMGGSAAHWPEVVVPERRGATTVEDVALAASVPEHAALVWRWAGDVWQAWRPAHAAIAALTDRHLLALVPGLAAGG